MADEPPKPPDPRVPSSYPGMQDVLARYQRNFADDRQGLRQDIANSIEQSERSSENAVPEAASKSSSGSESDRNFYAAITIYGAALGSGLFLLGDNATFSSAWWYGLIYTIGGGVGIMTVTPLFRPKFEFMRSSRSLWAVAAATWLLLAVNVGFAVYDHFWPKALAPSEQVASPDTWPALTSAQASALAARIRFIPPEEIVVACETLKCRDLADGIADILQRTPGWKVSILHRGGMDITGVVGIQLNPNEPASVALQEAIEATTGLAVTLGPDSRKDLGAGTKSYLVVGTRPF